MQTTQQSITQAHDEARTKSASESIERTAHNTQTGQRYEKEYKGIDRKHQPHHTQKGNTTKHTKRTMKEERHDGHYQHTSLSAAQETHETD